MRDNIIYKATEMFITLGFKSVTMDDVATKLGISKKTIYKFFENKERLIESCVDHVHIQIHTKINAIFELNKNAVEENFMIREMFSQMFKSDGDSPVFQLKKHYPLIFEQVRERESKQCKHFFTENLKKGIQQGYYNPDTNVEFAVLFYYMLIFGINETFESEKVVNKLELEALKYHTLAIATPIGIKELEKHLSNPNIYL